MLYWHALTLIQVKTEEKQQKGCFVYKDKMKKTEFRSFKKMDGGLAGKPPTYHSVFNTQLFLLKFLINMFGNFILNFCFNNLIK